jgi:hypothetical protein
MTPQFGVSRTNPKACDRGPYVYLNTIKNTKNNKIISSFSLLIQLGFFFG